MSEKNQVLKFFSQPVFKYQVKNFEELNKSLLDYIYNLQEKDKEGVKKSNILGWHSKPFDLSNKEAPPNKFFASINNEIADVFNKYGWVFEPSKVKCTSMWSIINKKNSFNIEHTHANHYLSAAYYVKAPENSGNFKISNPNIINRNRFPKSNKNTEFNSNTVAIKINAGDLLFFPSYLPHSVEENKSQEDRVVISFNLDILN
jgi:uncharacterized protein (TIGR02466 family)